MDRLVQQNPLLSPLSSPNPAVSGVVNLLSTPLSPPMSTTPLNISQSRPVPSNRNCTSPRLSETNEVIVYPSSVSLRVCINKRMSFFFSFSPYMY